MGDARHPRVRINPVEVVVFCGVALIFANSLYSLFYDTRALKSVASGGPKKSLSDSNARVSRQQAQASRSLASLGDPDAPTASRNRRSFDQLSLDCQALEGAQPNTPFMSTGAHKLRVVGELCKQTSVRSLDIRLQGNGTEAAVVFNNAAAGTFETDYLTLVPGRNLLEVRMTFDNGSRIERTLTILRN